MTDVAHPRFPGQAQQPSDSRYYGNLLSLPISMATVVIIIIIIINESTEKHDI